MIIATDEAIQTAIRNEQTMTGYEVTEFECVPGNFYVHTPRGEDYTVCIRAGVENCTCPYFQKEGICKHFVRCEKDAAMIAEAEERDFYGL
jgi:hypothetical protein